jgi:hypothetical protein
MRTFEFGYTAGQRVATLDVIVGRVVERRYFVERPR